MNRKFGNRAAVYVENGDVLALPKMTEGGQNDGIVFRLLTLYVETSP